MPLAEQVQEAFQDGYRMLEPVFLDYIEKKPSTLSGA